MLAAPAAIPPNPNIPATMANIIKVTVQRNIIVVFKLLSDYLLINTLQMSVDFGRELAAFGFYVNAIAKIFCFKYF